jgi:hypothetical protein
VNKTVIAVVTASTIFLVGCGGTVVNPIPVVVDPTPVVPVVPNKVDETVQRVLSGVQAACKFQTTADVALKVLTTFYSDASFVADYAGPAITAICQAANSLKTAKGSRHGHVPSVRGVPLEGFFVR